MYAIADDSSKPVQVNKENIPNNRGPSIIGMTAKYVTRFSIHSNYPKQDEHC